MQLKNKTRIKCALAVATSALLGSGELAAAEDKSWEIDAAFLYYSEDGRVEAAEPAIFAKKTFADDSKLNLNLVIDALTGASPNGAAPSDQVQTFTTPSGNGSYIAAPGETPLDDTFHDTRVQIGAGWEAPISRLTRYNIGANISTEYDYNSVGFSAGLAHDFNKKNTTLSVGLAYAIDSIHPEGGIPIPYASMAAEGAEKARDGDTENKNVADIMLGLTQVINANTVMQFNVGTSQSSGYMNDPFKILSIVDTNGRPVDYIYESRPDSRSKNYFYWSTQYHLPTDDTLNFSFRYMTDDWGIDSQTFDVSYRWNINDRWYLQPHVRLYQQTAADFYRHSLSQAEAVPVDVSSDYRLAEFDATTLGFKVGYKLDSKSEISARLETYQQKGDTKPNDAVGVQKQFEMFPDLDATIFQITYSFKF
jgi:hypothetical protein